MTDEEKKQLVDAVLTELQKNKKDISTATIIDALQGGEMVVCYDNEGKISRVSPQTITKTEYVTEEAYNNLVTTGQIKEDVEYNIYEE
jgi:nicotinamide mononucleotide (NMN) deamidase PncC